MTEAEAISELKYSPFGVFASEEACRLAINALEKQIAKKPVGLKKNICPNCSWGIVRSDQKYCDECGQKLGGEDTNVPSRCDACTHNVSDEVPPVCYFCSKGIEDNYEPIEQKGE